jgi:hypothetical protein
MVSWHKPYLKYVTISFPGESKPIPEPIEQFLSLYFEFPAFIAVHCHPSVLGLE